MKYIYVYAILLPKRDMEAGLFSSDVNLIEGDTEANCEGAVYKLCEKLEINFDKVKTYVVRPVTDEEISYLKE